MLGVLLVHNILLLLFTFDIMIFLFSLLRLFILIMRRGTSLGVIDETKNGEGGCGGCGDNMLMLIVALTEESSGLGKRGDRSA